MTPPPKQITGQLNYAPGFFIFFFTSVVGKILKKFECSKKALSANFLAPTLQYSSYTTVKSKIHVNDPRSL